MLRRQVVIELCRAFADLIHENAAAAEWTARKVAAVLERAPGAWPTEIVHVDPA